MSANKAALAPRVGPYSRPHVLLRLDGRRRESQLLAHVRAELTTHVGGSPSATERALIERAATLTLHISLMDTKAIEAGGMSARDSREYLAWSNALTRTLALLKLKPDAVRAPTLDDIKADIAAKRGAA